MNICKWISWFFLFFCLMTNGFCQTYNWIQLFPSGRSNASMAYDTATGKVILFGGIDNSGYLNDTWSFDGSTWTQLHPSSSPSARYDASMTYDEATQTLILFGGRNSSDYLSDTWSFNGSTWQNITPLSQSPQARSSASMAYATSTSTVILFGGTNNNQFDDTWSFNGSTWQNVTPLFHPLHLDQVHRWQMMSMVILFCSVDLMAPTHLVILGVLMLLHQPGHHFPKFSSFS